MSGEIAMEIRGKIYPIQLEKDSTQHPSKQPCALFILAKEGLVSTLTIKLNSK